MTLKRTKHPTEAVAALRGHDVPIAVATLDEAIRGAWARKLPVQVLVAHVRAPAVALVVAPTARETVRRVEDLRGKAVGIPGPGSTGHLLLAQLLRQARLRPWEVDTRSVGTTGLLARLGSGDLAAAMVEEPWAGRLLAADRAGPSSTSASRGSRACPRRAVLRVVSVVVGPPTEEERRRQGKPRRPARRSAARQEPPPEAALIAYARRRAGPVRLAGTPPETVAERLPARIVRRPRASSAAHPAPGRLRGDRGGDSRGARGDDPRSAERRQPLARHPHGGPGRARGARRGHRGPAPARRDTGATLRDDRARLKSRPA